MFLDEVNTCGLVAYSRSGERWGLGRSTPIFPRHSVSVGDANRSTTLSKSMDDKFAAGDHVVDRPVTHSVVFGELSDCPPVLHDDLKFFNTVGSLGLFRLPLP